MRELFIIVSSLLALISPLVYSGAILKGQARPHRTTRFVLLLITTLTTASLFAAGDRVAIWLAAVSTLQSVVIFTLSLKYGMGGWARSDLVCLITAVIGIIMWQTTRNPVYGLYFAIAADFTGMIPALIKTYRFPYTEIYQFYLLDVFAAGFNMLALTDFSFSAFSYPLYIMLINLVMVFLVIRPANTGKQAAE
ncbi:hypothetical protein A2Z33_00890 [Candidatus Gottesmanbacteria bacterium RBG_16_52_11]|uniref:Uncharacterized protein n=1 Tax=Candidatus Gottesmanbacteria bacterium RBG_16_52_11 TaxID=1798374 RepID=A0A1F5YNY1_9BACT|nr:MAG: hypothetical protein A2Z33_00890 [Candidatus Gottesmanbacteria bacterium RBG_16_52_11]